MDRSDTEHINEQWAWFSPGTPVSSTNKADRHDIAEILLKVALKTINQPIGMSHILC
jgi:hypothetical protein